MLQQNFAYLKNKEEKNIYNREKKVKILISSLVIYIYIYIFYLLEDESCDISGLMVGKIS